VTRIACFTVSKECRHFTLFRRPVFIKKLSLNWKNTSSQISKESNMFTWYRILIYFVLKFKLILSKILPRVFLRVFFSFFKWSCLLIISDIGYLTFVAYSVIFLFEIFPPSRSSSKGISDILFIRVKRPKRLFFGTMTFWMMQLFI